MKFFKRKKQKSIMSFSKTEPTNKVYIPLNGIEGVYVEEDLTTNTDVENELKEI